MGMFSFLGGNKKTSDKDTEKQAAEDNFNQAVRCLYNQEYEDAVKHMEMAAFLGNADALNYMGRFLFDGVLCEKDLDKAVENWKMAARKDHPEACYNLAVCYENGTSMRKNHDKAKSWAEKAVNLGYEGEIDFLD